MASVSTVLFKTPRIVDPTDVQLPPGYIIEPVITGLTFPTSMACDEECNVYVAEGGYAYGGVRTEARILRLERDGSLTTVIGGLRGPVTGIANYGAGFYVSEAGYPPRISYCGLDGGYKPILEGLPGPGDHGTGMPVVGPDGWLYFGQGAYTNAGVVGPDNHRYGWLQLQPQAHDVPGYDITLTGRNYAYPDPLTLDAKRQVVTGAFSSLGSPTKPGQRIQGQAPCTASIMRCRRDGSGLEVVAWGLRNPYGLLFTPDCRFYCIDQGYEERGVRPIGNAPDSLYEVRRGAWYGWPDYVAGEPAWSTRYRAENSAPAEPLLRNVPMPERPLATFGPHALAGKFDYAHNSFGYAGHLFVAEFGTGESADGAPGRPAGHRISRLDPGTRAAETFAANRRPGPASRHGGGGLEHPIEARFDAGYENLYIVDFGIMETVYGPGVRPYGRTGVLWRIRRG